MADPFLFVFIGDTVTNATNAFVAPAAAKLMTALQLTALAGVTLYITMTGYAISTGAVEAPFQTFLKQCMKIIIIAAFALTADGYHDQVVATLTGLQTGLSEALNANSASPSGSIYQTLDDLLNKGMDLTSICFQKADEAGWNFGAVLGWGIAGLIVALGTMVFALIGGVNIIVAQFSLAIMFALGPLFILALMFPITAKFFDGWLGQVLNYIFTAVILSMIMAFGVVAFNQFINGVDLSGSGDQNPVKVGFQIGGLTVALAYIAMQASSMASGLAGGVSLAALSLRQIVSPAASAAATAARPINPLAKSTRLDPRTGHQTTASRAEHLAMGRTVWAPAYRQALKERMQQGWKKPEGGTMGRG
ncbi:MULTISPECIES: type IV secretion system protein [Enterobacteriaceae]|uniref:type IV secretion system protein n=1 Tax=Enterobacteriaceae TaxID=543 RepID=UPI0003BB3B0D|nr:MULTISPECIES: type IV secretion system protein [Enterobacteriaceae]ESE18026.1 TrbL/VirB6 plasmid conjugal transfer protein [Escherichia coli 908691]